MRIAHQLPLAAVGSLGDREERREVDVVVLADQVRHRVMHDQVLVIPVRRRHAEEERESEEREESVHRPAVGRAVVRGRVGAGRHAASVATILHFMS